MIISEGDVADSYVVMKLDKHLEELAKDAPKVGDQAIGKNSKKEALVSKKSPESGLTRSELLDRINTDIAEMKRRSVEKEVVDSFKLKEKEEKDKGSEFYYEKVH